jgi:hypothetical protein
MRFAAIHSPEFLTLPKKVVGFFCMMALVAQATLGQGIQIGA